VAGVASTWTIVYETDEGDTESATQTLLPLRWERATWTLRRRAPHAFTITVPVQSHHLPGDFIAHRELRLLRDGVYVAWGAGFMGAVQLTTAGEDEWGPMELPGHGNAAALALFNRGTVVPGFLGTEYSGFDVDGIIGGLLNDVEHGSGGDWFTAGGRTLGTSALTIDSYYPRGKGTIEALNEITSLEGWTWRAGINSGGTFTFAASGTVDTDRSATIHCVDRANCRIAGVTQDDSRLLTNVTVYCRMPDIRTQLNGAVLAGASSITVDSTTGFEDDDWIEIGSGATIDRRVIDVVTSGTVLDVDTVGGLTYNQADNMEVKADTRYYRKTTRTAAASVAQTYHEHSETITNDQATDITHRQEYGDALIDTYDAVLRSATVETTDPALIAAMLDAGLEPGDSVKLTSNHRYLSAWYAGTTVKVHEMTVEVEPGGCRRITLQVGDPRLDDLGVLERMMAGARTSLPATQLV
jgi:hypothetical protein